MTRHENILALATLGEDEKNFVHFFRHISSDYLPKLPKSPETSRFWQTFSWKLLGVFDMGHFGRCYSTLNASSLSSRARRRNLLETVEYFIHCGVYRNLHVAAKTSDWLQSFRLKSKRSLRKQIPRNRFSRMKPEGLREITRYGVPCMQGECWTDRSSSHDGASSK